MEKPALRVVLCDDHPLVRRGVASLLAEADGITVVAEVGSAPEVVAAVRSHRPDVVVMDVRLPGPSGIEACRDIRSQSPEVRVLMLTSFTDDDAVLSSIMAGAAGYVLKRVGGEHLVEAVRQVGEGNSLLDPIVTGRVLAELRTAGRLNVGPFAELNDRERKILELVAEGLTNRQIASRVLLAEKTVKNYVSSILLKLHLSRRTELAAMMARHQMARREG